MQENSLCAKKRTHFFKYNSRTYMLPSLCLSQSSLILKCTLTKSIVRANNIPIDLLLLASYHTWPFFPKSGEEMSLYTYSAI